MKLVWLFGLFFLATMSFLGVFFILLVLANIVSSPAQDAGAFYRYMLVSAVFSLYLAPFLCSGARHSVRHAWAENSLVEQWLLRRDEQGKIQIRLLNTCAFAVAVFILIWIPVLAIAGLNALFGQSMPLSAFDPLIIGPIALVSVMCGMTTPLIYKLEIEYKQPC